MSKKSPPKNKTEGGKAKAFDPSAFYAQVAESKKLREQFLEQLIARIRKSSDPPKFLFDVLTDYCHGRRKDEWKKLRKISFAETLYDELCLILDAPELSGQWKPLAKGLQSADMFLALAVSVTPGEREDLEVWLRERKHLPLVVLAAHFRTYGGVFDRLMRGWLLKMDKVLRGDHDSVQSVSEDSDRWLETVLGVKRSPRTLRNYLAPVVLAYMQGEETRRLSERLREEIGSLHQSLEVEEGRVKDLEAAAKQAGEKIEGLDEIIIQKDARIVELEGQLNAEVGLGESSVRNAVGSRLASLRQAIGPDLEDLEALLDQPNPDVPLCLTLLARIKKNLTTKE